MLTWPSVVSAKETQTTIHREIPSLDTQTRKLSELVWRGSSIASSSSHSCNQHAAFEGSGGGGRRGGRVGGVGWSWDIERSVFIIISNISRRVFIFPFSVFFPLLLLNNNRNTMKQTNHEATTFPRFLKVVTIHPPGRFSSFALLVVTLQFLFPFSSSFFTLRYFFVLHWFLFSTVEKKVTTTFTIPVRRPSRTAWS